MHNIVARTEQSPSESRTMNPQLTAFAPPEGVFVSFGRPGGHE